MKEREKGVLGEEDLHMMYDKSVEPGKLTSYGEIIDAPELRPSKIGFIDSLKFNYLTALREGDTEKAFWYIVEIFDAFEGVNPPNSISIKKRIEELIAEGLNRADLARKNGQRVDYPYSFLRIINKKVNYFLNNHLKYMAKKNYDILTSSSYEKLFHVEGAEEEKKEIQEDLENKHPVDTLDPQNLERNQKDPTTPEETQEEPEEEESDEIPYIPDENKKKKWYQE